VTAKKIVREKSDYGWQVFALGFADLYFHYCDAPACRYLSYRINHPEAKLL
jgi:hypothetical protein